MITTMSATSRLPVAVAVAGLAVALTGAPAAARVAWSDPQQISPRFGQQLSLSDDGATAAWIQVRRAGEPGAVYTSVFRGVKRGWARPRLVPGTAESEQVQLTGDGGSLLIKDQTAYSVATRQSRGRWAEPEEIAESAGTVMGYALLVSGRISADGRVVVWVDGTDAGKDPVLTLPIRMRARERAADGTWGAVADLGEIRTSIGSVTSGLAGVIALSADGSTAVWVDNSSDLVSAGRAADGTWGPPAVIQAYGNEPSVRDLRLSADGARVVWNSGASAVLTATRAGSGWTAPTYVMQKDVSSVAMSPNGRVVAYQQGRARLRVRRYVSGRWTPPQTLGPSQWPQIAVRNKAVAWVESQGEAGSPLRVSLLKKGKWTPATTVAPNGAEPTLSRQGDTLAWAGVGVKKIFSVQR